jgi:hypothetical protein
MTPKNNLKNKYPKKWTKLMDHLFIIYTKIRIFIQNDLVRFKMCKSLGVKAWVHICKWY